MNKNSYKYYILKEKNLYVEILRGRFVLMEFVDLKKSESENPDFDPDFNSILDIRDIEDVFSKQIQDDLGKYLEIIKPIQHVTKRKKAAVITNTPSQVAGITWYKYIDDRGVDYKAFSTLEAAIKWLGIDENDLKDVNINIAES